MICTLHYRSKSSLNYAVAVMLLLAMSFGNGPVLLEGNKFIISLFSFMLILQRIVNTLKLQSTKIIMKLILLLEF